MNKLLVSTLLGGLLLVGVSSARAQTFAGFLKGTTSGGWQLTAADASGVSTLQTTGTVNVIFQFQGTGVPTTMSGVPFYTNIPATVILKASSSDAAFPAGTNDQQDFDNISFSIVATQNVGSVTAGSVLLAGTSGMNGDTIGGTLSGVDSSQLSGNQTASAGFSGHDNPNPLNPLAVNTVTFSSDYIDFTGASQKTFSYAFTNILPNFTISGLSINPFTADGAAIFSAVFPPPAVPEPGSVAMFIGLGVSGTMFYFRGRRRRNC